MAGKSSQADNRGTNFLGFLVSGKGRQFHTYRDGAAGTSSGLTATGGVISDYTDGPAVYRAHIFTSSGTFEVTSPGDFGDTVEYLVVAGGGGGGVEGSQRGGGGGAGGYRTNVPTPIGPGNHTTTNPFPVSVTSYDVIIGAGAAGGDPGSGQGYDGSNSQLGPPSLAERIISNGGGGGGRGSVENPQNLGRDGGSGGGGGSTSTGSATEPGGSTIAVTTPSPWPGPSTQGFAGGYGEHDDGSWAAGGGGGGAGEAGSPAANPNTNSSHGGDGLSNLIAGPENTGVGVVNPAAPGRWFAGGGAGIHFSPGTGTGGAGGGGSTSYPGAGDDGVYATGGGGASGSVGGSGGSGIVIVRYQIAQLTADAKATGGAISYYNGKTIHTFTNTGTFTAPGSFSETVEYVVVAGGGGGGKGANNRGGGGGAGGYLTGTTPITGPSPIAITVGAGGAGAGPLAPAAIQGGQSVAAFPSPITSTGGGLGGNEAGNGGDGGSGGGAGGVTSGQTLLTAGIGSPPQGNPGSQGYAVTGSEATGGGGGGAGGPGRPISDGTTRAHGGLGVQLPSTFRNPVSQPGSDGGGLGAPGPGSTYFWVAGGGGAATGTAPDIGLGGSGTSDSGPFAGGGDGGPDAPDGITNTGGGGGGGASTGGSGGSGLVLIAYPT